MRNQRVQIFRPWWPSGRAQRANTLGLDSTVELACLWRRRRLRRGMQTWRATGRAIVPSNAAQGDDAEGFDVGMAIDGASHHDSLSAVLGSEGSVKEAGAFPEPVNRGGSMPELPDARAATTGVTA